MPKELGVNIHNVGETTQFFGTQKQSDIGQFTYDFKKK
jgi:hypothetical protein